MNVTTYDSLYQELDGVLVNSSRKGRIAQFARRYGEDPDSLIGEVRVALWGAFRSYDWNAARGGVSALAERVLKNTLSNFAASRRRDRLVFDDDDDKPRAVSVQLRDEAPLRTDEWFKRAYQDPRLNERRRTVFELTWHPPEDFVNYLAGIGGKSSNVAIGAYLGFTKNQVDWDVRAINEALGAVLLREDFADLRDLMVGEFGWPGVWTSEHHHDQELIERIAEQYNLDLDSPTRLTYDQASGRLRRTIETHAWGAICFLRYGSKFATVVILGRITWFERHVYRNNGAINLGDVLPWYAKLDAELKTVDMQIPRCFGEYDPEDKICRGDPNSDVKSERAPCAFRDRCVAFEMYCKKNREKPPQHVKYVGEDGEEYGELIKPESLIPALDRLVSVHEIVNGKIRRKNPKAKAKRILTKDHQVSAGKSKTKTSQKIAAKSAREALEPSRVEVGDLARWYLKRLGEKAGIEVAPTQVEAEPGQFYIVDRTDTSNYLALYLKREGGGRLPVTNALFRPRHECLEVRLACEFGSLDIPGVTLEDHTGKDGAFKIRVRNLKRAGLSLVADAVAAALKSGKLGAPSGAP